MGRPPGVEWPDDGRSDVAPDGAPLLRDGRIQAGYRDASWWDRPNTSYIKATHVIVASHRPALGYRELGWASACAPTRIVMDLEGSLVRDAATVPRHARCARRACALLFAAADAAAGR